MKGYSSYFKWMLLTSLVFWFMAIFSIASGNPQGSAVLFVIGFVLWFVAVNAPDSEKYEKPKNKYTPRQ
jgi:hypothetical protein